MTRQAPRQGGRVRAVAVATAALAGLGLLVAPVADAGSTPPPDVRAGDVVYSAPTATVNCAGSTPQSVTWQFTYNASQLGAGSYDLSAGGFMSTAGSGASAGSWNLAPVPVSVTPGDANGQFSHTFALPRAPRATGSTVALNATMPTDPNAYDFETSYLPLTCGAPSSGPQAGPSVSVSPVSCTDRAVLRVDGTNATGNWYWTVNYLTGGFVPGASPVRPGTVQPVSLTYVSPGQKVGVAFTSVPGPDGSYSGMHGGTYTLANGCTPPPCPSAPFPDVPVSNPFCGAISWLVTQKIAGGYADGTFRPGDTVSRQAMAAFLYSYANPGKTAPACATAPFPDVPANSQFCPQIQWLVSQVIASGYGDGNFHPTDDVSRQAMAAFLYRLANPGKFAPGCSQAAFVDVPTDNAFCGAISWLVGQNISGGYPDGGFHPLVSISRGAMAAFLYRLNAATKTGPGPTPSPTA